MESCAWETVRALQLSGDKNVTAMSSNRHSGLCAICLSDGTLFTVSNKSLLPDSSVHPNTTVRVITKLSSPAQQLKWDHWSHGERLGVVTADHHGMMFRPRMSDRKEWVSETLDVGDVESIDFSPNSELACAIGGKLVVLREPSWNQQIIYEAKRKISCVGWAGSGLFLACGDQDGWVRLFQVSTGRNGGADIGQLHLDAEAIRYVAWGPRSGRSYWLLCVIIERGLFVCAFNFPQKSMMQPKQQMPLSFDFTVELQRRAPAPQPPNQQCEELARAFVAFKSPVSHAEWSTTGDRIACVGEGGCTTFIAIEIQYQRTTANPGGKMQIELSETGTVGSGNEEIVIPDYQ